MICQNIILKAPVNRSDYVLAFISNKSHTFTYKEVAGMVVITIGLCIKEEITLEDIRKAINLRALMEMFLDIREPIMHRYILEDGQSIIHVQEMGHDEDAMPLQDKLDMLLLDKHARLRDKNWQEPFLPYWQE